MNEPQSITSLPESPDAERHRRMIQYLIAMTIRVGCVIASFFVQGWWLVVPVLGAIVLPWVAVLLANVVTQNEGSVQRPGAIVPTSSRRRAVDE